jgi:hypothetical protein
MKTTTYVYILMVSILCFSCNTKKETEVEKKPEYLADIGDTEFNEELDDPNFTFCDATNVLHKRAKITYIGGTPAMEKELISNYKKQPEFESFTGYFFIRFAVNCKNESGRFRWEIVDEDFKEMKCPDALEKEIITKVKNLKKWNHPIYKGESHDGYTFLIVKIENGNIVRS